MCTYMPHMIHCLHSSFYQVLLLVHDIYDVPFPRVYLEFLMKWFGWFDFEFLKFARVECVRKTVS